MARITVEDCLEVVDNRFELVLMASKRARQLAKGVEPTLDNSEAQRQADRAGPARNRRAQDRPELIDAVEKAERERAEREALEWAAAEVVDDDLAKGGDDLIARCRLAGRETALPGPFFVSGRTDACGSAAARIEGIGRMSPGACPRLHLPIDRARRVPIRAGVTCARWKRAWPTTCREAQVRRCAARTQVGAAAHAGPDPQVRRALHHPSDRGRRHPGRPAAGLRDPVRGDPARHPRGHAAAAQRHRRASSARRSPNWSTASPSSTSCSSATARKPPPKASAR